MGLLSSIYDPTPRADMTKRAPYDEFWYTDPPSLTDTGITVTPDLSMKYSVVWACVRLISQQVAGLPLMIHKRTAEGKTPAPEHPLYEILHDRPNTWQTSYQFREMMTMHVLLRGNAYAVRLAGPKGATDQLVPLHPDRMRVESDQRKLKYFYMPAKGDEIPFLQEEIFHLAGPSLDGQVGMSVIALASQGIGLALAMESYGALFFKQNATPRIALEMDHKTDSREVDEAIQKQWMEAYGGLANSHKPAILKMGMKAHVIGISNEDSQFLESRNHQVADIARWFLVKPHKVNELSRATFNNIEHQSLEHLTDTLDPWLIRWEQTILRDLIGQPKRFFAEFMREGLLQADIKSKNEAFAIAIQNGWMNRNEVRQKLNMNRVDGLDEYLTPMNMAPSSASAQNARAAALAEAACDRILAREEANVKKWEQRLSGDEWDRWCVDFFGKNHLAFVANALQLPPEKVQSYCDFRLKSVRMSLSNGLGREILMRLALGEEE